MNRLRNLSKSQLVDLCRKKLPDRVVRRMEDGRVIVAGAFGMKGTKAGLYLRVTDAVGPLVRRHTWIVIWEIRQPVGEREPYRQIVGVCNAPVWAMWQPEYPPDNEKVCRRLKAWADRKSEGVKSQHEPIAKVSNAVKHTRADEGGPQHSQPPSHP